MDAVANSNTGTKNITKRYSNFDSYLCILHANGVFIVLSKTNNLYPRFYIAQNGDICHPSIPSQSLASFNVSCFE